jgi:hypothetical protein
MLIRKRRARSVYIENRGDNLPVAVNRLKSQRNRNEKGLRLSSRSARAWVWRSTG